MCIGWLRIGNTCDNQRIIPDGSVDELHVFRLILSAYIYQVMATYTDDALSMDTQLDKDDRRLIKLYTMAIGESDITVDCFKLRQHIKRAIVEFARPVALFYHAITLVPPPEALKGWNYTSIIHYLFRSINW
jgi:hypothetical protein